MMYCDYFESPLGTMEIKATDEGICQVIFCGEHKEPTVPSRVITQCIAQLEEYFTGTRQSFDLPLDPVGTEFQKSVWQALCEIPFGHTHSYLQLAEQLNNPKAVRAVGGANGRNPKTLIVPCHRVIGASGTLTGYAGGVERKQWLLAHEGVPGFAKPLALDEVIHTRQDKTQFLR